MASRPNQTAPDLEFMDFMALFVYEKSFLLNRFYLPSFDDAMEKAFNLIKSTPPMHLLLAGTSTFELI
jgi:hypothetical protein